MIDQENLIQLKNVVEMKSKQMCWDPELGFMTQQQMDQIKKEREIKKRQIEGRPFPKNEAERILEALESRRGASSGLSEVRRITHLPQIPVPTPASLTAQRSSSIQLLARSKTKNSLAALYEEEEAAISGKNKKKLIAPHNKRLEQDRLKRLEERKGRLREELRKLKKYEEKLAREHTEVAEGSEEMKEPEGTRSRKKRSASTETNRQPRRSSRKIASLQPMIPSTNQKASSSLRPGRTFSSRKHIKAKVFSAREEDLPSLGDEDDEEAAEKEIASLKKIKLPTTFPSSFKLEKFASPKPLPASSLPSIDQSLPPATRTSDFTDKPSAFSFAKPSSTTEPVSKPSPFFSQPPTKPAEAPTLGLIPGSAATPPNFFGSITSSINPTAEKPAAPNSNLFANTNTTQATTELVEKSGPETVMSTSLQGDKATSSVSSQPPAPSQPSIFGSGTLGATSNPSPAPAAATTTSATVNGEAPKSLFGTPALNPAAPSFSFGAAPPPTTSLFGNPTAATTTAEPAPPIAVSAPASTGFSFGSQSTPPTSSLFGGSGTMTNEPSKTDQAPAITPSIFGNTATTAQNNSSTFNFNAPTSTTTNNTSSSPNLFGNVSAPVTSSASSFSFGTQPVAPASPAPTAFSFGQPTGPTPASAPSFAFGTSTPTAASTPLFGQAQPPAPASTGFNFGGTTNTIDSGSIFGKPTATNTTTPGPASTNGFNFGATTTSFGATSPPVVGSPFGNSSGSGFQSFGNSTTTLKPLESNATTTGTSLFGSSSVAPTPTSNGTGPVGSFTNANNGFFGPPASTTVNGFGNNHGSSNNFGATNTAIVVGPTTNGNGVFGVNNSTGVGSIHNSQNSVFGSNQNGTTTSPFAFGTTTNNFGFGNKNNNTPLPPTTPTNLNQNTFNSTPVNQNGGGNLFNIGAVGPADSPLGGNGRSVKRLPGRKKR
ncbi:hypothetical protein CROQUDRAFT_287961 [Cronartium quercuum f. sp. fusiforme G11]|uniref:Uncharacterized protein n=1 Tax=Cronartium quercuum f. sp. fusiforme G11 TaxID=708437 RepID=A0A9P6NQ89_9BASI|nr:hypothetical protein CROQUDRAFT_287961 [Cronartium quercuum f. sp. fusiforme G11]